jgi:hypothetical protein
MVRLVTIDEKLVSERNNWEYMETNRTVETVQSCLSEIHKRRNSTGKMKDRKVYSSGVRGTCMASTTFTDKTRKLGITLPVSLLKQTDKARGDVPRSTFIRRALEQYIRARAPK